jgi:lysophospholipase L1-like esterase
MNHIVLLGDSVFDNAVYINGGIEVIAHLRHQIPTAWKATLRAVDGSTIENIHNQILDLPSDTTHLMISVGGNDALQMADLLEAKARSAAEALNLLANASEEFERRYNNMLNAVLPLNIPTAICTIYYPRFPEPIIQRLAVTALSVFNDVIIREAFRAGLPLLDLRLICNRDEDYANPIEPSEGGGRKIAEAMVRLIREYHFESKRTAVFV